MTRYLTLLDRLKDKQMPDRRGGDKFQFFENLLILFFSLRFLRSVFRCFEIFQPASSPHFIANLKETYLKNVKL